MNIFCRILVFLALFNAGPGTVIVAAESGSDYKLGDRLPQTGAPADARAPYREVTWDTLLPPGWNPMDAFKGINLAMLSDGDPRAIQALERLKEEWDKAPANTALNGERIRIPGFVVPLDQQKGELRQFLLVPYFGACIHTPPPPSNQIIHVLLGKPVKNLRAMDPVWVSGALETTRSETGMGAAGYRMKGDLIAAYKETRR